jgi:hypothetical protein
MTNFFVAAFFLLTNYMKLLLFKTDELKQLNIHDDAKARLLQENQYSIFGFYVLGKLVVFFFSIININELKRICCTNPFDSLMIVNFQRVKRS